MNYPWGGWPPPPQVPGATGPAGSNGLNAYTLTIADFVQPAANVGYVSVQVENAEWAALGQVVYLSHGGGYYAVYDAFGGQLDLINLGYPGNAAPGDTILSGAKAGPAGLRGATGPAGSDALAGGAVDYFNIAGAGGTVNCSGTTVGAATVVHSHSYTPTRANLLLNYTGKVYGTALGGSLRWTLLLVIDGVTVDQDSTFISGAGQAGTLKVFGQALNLSIAAHVIELKVWVSANSFDAMPASTLGPARIIGTASTVAP